MFGLSKEQTKFQTSLNRCPHCGKFIMIPHYLKADGTRIHPLKMNLLFMDRSVLAKCPKCGHRWPVFAGHTPPKSDQQYVVELVESSRSEEPIGEEQRLIDNSRSGVELERRFTVRKEWSQSLVIEKEKARTDGGEITVGVSDAASLKLVAEQAIKEKYTISEDTTHSYTEEIILKVPAKTRLRVIFYWKRIWQHGIIKLRDEQGRSNELPFKVAVGATFDQMQVDEK